MLSVWVDDPRDETRGRKNGLVGDLARLTRLMCLLFGTIYHYFPPQTSSWPEGRVEGFSHLASAMVKMVNSPRPTSLIPCKQRNRSLFTWTHVRTCTGRPRRRCHTKTHWNEIQERKKIRYERSIGQIYLSFFSFFSFTVFFNKQPLFPDPDRRRRRASYRRSFTSNPGCFQTHPHLLAPPRNTLNITHVLRRVCVHPFHHPDTWWSERRKKKCQKENTTWRFDSCVM